MLTDLDSFFNHIEKNKLTAVLLTVPQLILPAPLIKILKSSDIEIFEMDSNSLEVLQVGRVPQIRIYLNGNEKYNLISNELLKFGSIYKSLEHEVQCAKKPFPHSFKSAQ